MRSWILHTAIIALLLMALTVPVVAGNLYGNLRDENWFARRAGAPAYGVGVYEFGMNANAQNISSVGGADFTRIYGDFSMGNLPGGNYTIGSWSVWWRPAYAFNVNVPEVGSISNIDMRLKSTMWGYASFWDDAAYYEFGQTFKATGAISMIFLRIPHYTTYTVTVHQGGPGGPQVGIHRVIGGGDQRLTYGYGQMPTVAGQMYYLRVVGSGGVIRQMDPRPDFIDPMPEGCLWLGTGGTPVAQPGRNLGVAIMSDDDGLLTNIYNLSTGHNLGSASSFGQTFVARGVSLISAAIHIPTSNFTGVFRILNGGPGGAQVGTVKRSRVGQWATPQIIALWAPGEVPLTPGNTYYLEVTRDGGGEFSAYASGGNQYVYGQAYRNGAAQSNVDLTSTIMEEQSPGSATQPSVVFNSYPSVADADRQERSLTIRFTTNVASDSLIEWGAWNTPYTHQSYQPAQTTNHAVTITGLEPNTMYHYRVTSSRSNYRKAISRDQVITTRTTPGTNLLVNADMEEGTGTSPRWPIPGWTSFGSTDIKASNGNWFGGGSGDVMHPQSGNWFIEGGAMNSTLGGVYQRVAVTPGKQHNFTGWVITSPRENIGGNTVIKYDVWDNMQGGRLIWMRLGIDPSGGTNPNSGSIIWTPRMYSHQRYTNLGLTAMATSSHMTVFVEMEGNQVEWCLFGFDNAALTVEAEPCVPPTIITHPQDQTVCVGQNATFSVVADGDGPLSYQWQMRVPGGNFNNLSGATSSSYTTPTLSSAGSGREFRCVVTSSCDPVTSNAALLTVNSPVSITTHPVSQTKNLGESVTFSVAATGTEPITYQWRKGGVNIPNATSSSYNIAAVSVDDAGSYDCVVTNPCGSVSSNAATLTVIMTGSVADAKRQADDTSVGLSAKLITAVFGDVFYIEESDRSSGIKVVRSGHGRSAGDKVDIAGIMKTGANGERYVEATSAVLNGTGMPKPVLMINRELGGDDWEYNAATGAGQKGVLGASGLNNIGRFIWTSGRVTHVGSGYFYVDDGSGLRDSSNHDGVKVMGTVPVDQGENPLGVYVKVVGISTCFKDGVNLYRQIDSTLVLR